MILIPLTQGQTAVVDDIDADLAELKWYADKPSKTFYAARRSDRGPDGRLITQRLHCVIAARMGISGRADHRDRDGLNCTRENLRSATRSQNNANRRLQSNNSSGVKGVYWHRQTGKWQARVVVNRTSFDLGLFVDKDEAERAVKDARQRLHGEFCCHG